MTTVRERERRFLERLKENYEADGFEFFIEPPADMVPKFLGRYRPDAIAIRADGSIIIEIKSNQTDRESPKLSQIAASVASEPRWKFVVYTLDQQESQNDLSVPEIGAVSERVQEIDDLIAKGFLRPAVIMSWSILEAAHRIIVVRGEYGSSRPFSPIQTVQFLEMRGLVNYEEGRFLRETVRLRNALVHGDFEFNFSEGTVTFLRDVVKRVTAHLDSHLRG